MLYSAYKFSEQVSYATILAKIYFHIVYKSLNQIIVKFQT